MSNNIITGVLAVLCVVLAIFGVVLYTQVAKLEFEVMTSRVLVQRSEEAAKELKRLAEENASEAQLARRQLQECAKRIK